MRVLVIDDNQQIAEIVASILISQGHDVSTFHDSVRTISEIRQKDWDLVVTDMYMPDCDGFDILREVRHSHAPSPVIVMSGGERIRGGFDPLHCARELGAAAVLRKPFCKRDLLDAVRRVKMSAHRVAKEMV